VLTSHKVYDTKVFVDSGSLFIQYFTECLKNKPHFDAIGLNIALKRKRSCGEVVMTELEIAVAPMHRLCKKAGADRVSEAAAKELAKALEEIGVKIAKESLDFAMHAGRKTIKAEDIQIAARKVMGR
jgi:histone H3/H4